MKISERVKGATVRRILTGMIVNDRALSRIATTWTRDKFAAPWANLIGGWCVEYWKKYNRAPRKSIEALFGRWAEKNRDEASVKIVEKLLTHISNEYDYKSKSVHPDELVDRANAYFKEIRSERLIKSLEGDLEANDFEKFDQRLLAFQSRPDVMADSEDEDIFSNEDIVYSSFDNLEYMRLVRYPGALDKFFYNMLERGRFLAIQGAEKSGKSYWLEDIGIRGLQRRRRVGFFAIGDMTKLQMRWRMFERIALHPMWSNSGGWPCKIKVPVRLVKPDYKAGEKLPRVKYKTLTFKRPLDGSKSWKACQDIMSDWTRSKHSYFKMAWYPNFTASMSTVVDKIKMWQDQDFSPDIIILDYADLLAPTAGKQRTEREDTDINWKMMRAISQTNNCLFVTATQAKATAYKKRTQDRSDVGIDKRKQAHVDGMFAINFTDEEKELGVVRLNWLQKRHGFFTSKRQVYVGQCLSLAHPSVISAW